ncbi:MAG: hypothetical protein AABZ10_15360 [Nitrospirota bacterium]
MHQSLIINFLTRNVNKLQPLDYAILAVLGVALLVAVIVVFRLVLRAFSGRKRSSTGISATADEAVFADREVLKLFQVERQALERQVAVLDETFAAFRDIYREKRSSGAKLEDLCDRVFNYGLSLRAAFLQMIAATNAFLAFERARALFTIYVNAGIEHRFPDAPTVRDLEVKLDRIRQNVVEPLLHGNGLNLPDAKQFFTEFTVPAPKQLKVEVFDADLDGLYQDLKNYVERYLNNGKKKAALIADRTQDRRSA